MKYLPLQRTSPKSHLLNPKISIQMVMTENFFMRMLRALQFKLRISRLYWHDLKSLDPVSRQFGLERGVPIDRYYIEKFLDENKSKIEGILLEVADSKYSKRFGNNVVSYEVLHIEKSDRATLIGDLSKPETLPENLADCFICTQVFNFIYEFKKAIEGSHKMLKPGGVLLATVGGISQISRFDADRWGHFWSFYPQGIESTMKEVFGMENVKLSVYGNSLSAISFLKGLSTEDLTKNELDFIDIDYPITIALVAIKK